MNDELFIKIYSLSCWCFKKKKQEVRLAKNGAASRGNTQPFSEYLSFRRQFILILRFVYMLNSGEPKSTTLYMLLSMNMMSS